ncbi:MAG: tRNA-dihydrouridine synthase family protein [Planctomycetota bacterium]
MSVIEPESSNATAPTPGIAPGSDNIDAHTVAQELAEIWAGGGRPGTQASLIQRAVPGFDAPFFQAGLAGYSDAAMRIIARRHGCPFCVTEALLDRTMLAGGRGFAKADLGELHENVPSGPEDHPLACQIMGSNPGEMSAAALKAAEQGKQGEKFYRTMAYGNKSGYFPSTRVALRLPGGEQLPPMSELDASEGLGESCGDFEEETCETLVDQINDMASLDGAASVSERSLESRRGASDSPEHGGASGTLGPELSFECIDVNLACPVKKIKAKARGGHWLAEPEGAIRILEAVREAVPASIPCSVKLRRSFDDTPEMAQNIHTILDAAHAMGYAWATVHARTVMQKYVGPSRWDLLRDIVRRQRGQSGDAGMPIFGSGDIWNAADIFRMIAYTGVAAVAVARGCIGNPWIFRQARAMMAGRPPTPPTIAEQRAVLEDHFRLLLAVNHGMRQGEEHTSKLMRKFGIRFATHHPRTNEARLRFIGVKSDADWRAVLDEMYAPA